MAEPKTLSSRQASREARRIWERLYLVIKSEEAWQILDEELDAIKNPCLCRVGKRYRLDQSCDCNPEEDK